MTMRPCSVLRNEAGGDGGGLPLWDVPLDATDCDIVGNSAAGGGGGWSYHNLHGGLSPRMTDCRILRSLSAGPGGGALLLNQIRCVPSDHGRRRS